jgi:hypothetical protein
MTMMTSRASAIRQTLPITRLEIDDAIISNGFARAPSIRFSLRHESAVDDNPNRPAKKLRSIARFEASHQTIT